MDAHNHISFTDKLFIMMSLMLNRLAETHFNPDWSHSQRLMENDQVLNRMDKFLDISPITVESLRDIYHHDLFRLGFRCHSVNDHNHVWLIPVWMVNYLKVGTLGHNLQGHKTAFCGNLEYWKPLLGNCIPFGILVNTDTCDTDPDIETDGLVPHELRTDEHI